MEAVTLLIAAAASALIFFLSPIYGLVVYMAALIWYPQNLGVELGPADFSVSRIVILALYLSIFLKKDALKQFKFIWLDKLVIIYFAARILSGATTTPDIMKLVEYNSGVFFDRALPYFAVRIIITNKEQYLLFLKWVLWLCAPLAILAFFECLTAHNLLAFGRVDMVYSGHRWGHYRARATFNHPIYLGVFFAMVGAICAGLLKNIKKGRLFYMIGIGLTGLGVFSSLSSGGLFAMVAAILFIAFYRFRHYWKTAIIGVILMCGVVEVLSNRHFYDVVDRFAFNAATGWYRTRLFEVALFEGGMSGHWLTGYGMADPMWCDKIDMRDHTDMVNQYLLILCRFGLVGFVPFLLITGNAIKHLFKGFWKISAETDSWLVWCLAAGLFSVLLAFNSVSLFGQPINLFFIMLGLCAVLPAKLAERAPFRLV